VPSSTAPCPPPAAPRRCKTRPRPPGPSAAACGPATCCTRWLACSPSPVASAGHRGPPELTNAPASSVAWKGVDRSQHMSITAAAMRRLGDTQRRMANWACNNIRFWWRHTIWITCACEVIQHSRQDKWATPQPISLQSQTSNNIPPCSSCVHPTSGHAHSLVCTDCCYGEAAA